MLKYFCIKIRSFTVITDLSVQMQLSAAHDWRVLG